MTQDHFPEPDWTCMMPDPEQQAAASKHWHLVVAEMRQAGTLAAANAAQIKRYVITLVLYDMQATALFDEGTIKIVNKKTRAFVVSPRWLMYKDTNTIATALEECLGLTPRRRGSVTKATTAKPKANPAESYLKVV